jgi:sodium/proline symporter
MELSVPLIEIIFIVTLSLTFTAAYYGRKHSKASENGLANEKLNKWMIGLSAGATANSGFIVTGAVGLGYSFGAQWLLLPISWFLGDLLFWKFCPARINAVGQQAKATTLSELLNSGLSGKMAKSASMLATLIIILCLGAYTSAQWLAGQKFVAGAFEFSGGVSLLLFACLIIAYSSIGGFRGSVYADAVQAVIRLIGTALALVAIFYVAYSDSSSLEQNWALAGESFFDLLPGNALGAGIFFVLGYIFAAFGFGLGQPQLLSRYLSGSSPEETKSAQWIYIGFVQFTWISMTLFGIYLRGVMPEIEDPEAGLSLFFRTHFGELLTGIIVADIFSTIAATSNSLLIAMSQAVIHDFLPSSSSKKRQSISTSLVVLILGALTMLGTILIAEQSSVFELAIGAVSLMGAGLAAPILIRIFEAERTGLSLLLSMLAGLISAICWKYAQLGGLINEAAIGIVIGFITNFMVVVVSKKSNLNTAAKQQE